MTNRLALILFLLIAGLIALDVTQNASGVVIFLGRKFVDLIQLLAFWR